MHYGNIKPFGLVGTYADQDNMFVFHEYTEIFI